MSKAIRVLCLLSEGEQRSPTKADIKSALKELGISGLGVSTFLSYLEK